MLNSTLIKNATIFSLTYLILIGIVVFLRYRGILKPEDKNLFSKLVITVILPVLLIIKLIHAQLSYEIIKVSVVVILAEVVVCLMAILSGKYLLKLPKKSLIVFVFCCTFSSTAILGLIFIQAIFKDNPLVIANAILISQIANGIPTYILFPIIFKKIGDEDMAKNQRTQHLKSILTSPTIIAVIIGLILSTIKLPTEGILITSLLNVGDYIGSSMVFMVVIITGLLIDNFSLKHYIKPIILCIILLLVCEPLLVYVVGQAVHISLANQQISFILASMPAANSIVAFSVHYKCDDKLAAILVFSTVIVGSITLPLLMHCLSIFY